MIDTTCTLADMKTPQGVSRWPTFAVGSRIGVLCLASFACLLSASTNLARIWESTIRKEKAPRSPGLPSEANHLNTRVTTHSLKRLLDDSRFEKLSTDDGLTSFPTPDFHGCTRTGMCHLSNVCFSGQDRMLVFDVPGFDHNSTSPLNRSTRTKRPRILPFKEYSRLINVYMVHDDIFVMNCFRQKEQSTNPTHFLMGHGKLFAAATGYHVEGPESFGLLLYHQCQPPHWPWAEKVGSLIWDYATSTGTVKRPRDETELYLSYTQNYLQEMQNGNMLDANALVICGRTVYQEPFSTGMFFGNNDPYVVSKWRDWVGYRINTSNPSEEPIRGTCEQNLQISVLKRLEGSSLRRFMNMDEIENLVAEYTHRPLKVIEASSELSFEQQVTNYRSFDVLLLPIGSHSVNMIFGDRDKVAYIEVQSVYRDSAFFDNGQSFSKLWIESFGHAPHNRTDLAENMEACHGKVPTEACPFEKRRAMFHSNLTVNTTILRQELEKTISVLCPRIA